MSVAGGALVTVAMRWTDRLIGFVSTIILARLLMPDDFGVVAQAGLVMGLLAVLTNLGVNVALIQNANASQADYDTAWTIRLLQYSVVCLVVFSIAPYAGDYFGDPRVVPVLRVMVAGLVLAGIENIGVVTFQKEMRFGLDFRFLFTQRLVSFVVTTALAFAWRSYWALVVGQLVGRAISVVLSYSMHAMRPRLTLSRFSQIFSVSQWTLVGGVGSYLDNNLDRFVIGGRATSAVVGGYTVANEISALPSSELLAPLNRVLFPAFVRAKHDPVELKRLFLVAQGVQCLVAIPASVGLALVAREAVTVLLGEQWLLVVPFVQVLALIYAVHAISTSAGYVIITLGRIRYVALIMWFQVILFALSVFMIFPNATASDVAWSRLCATCVGFVLVFWSLQCTNFGLRVSETWASVQRPVFAVLVMVLAIKAIEDEMVLSVIWVLTIKILVGVVVYTGCVMLLWWTAGRPYGAESYLLECSRKYFSKP